jgi:hypothetical protein
MKLNVKALGLTCGIFTAVTVAWSVFMILIGVGSGPYRVLSQFYLNLFPPTIFGLIIGAVIGFIDGFIAGAIFAWLYNKIAKQ